MKIRFIYILSAIILIFSSCSKYQKLLKSTDLGLKYDKAIEFYENEEYTKALPLFEELIIIYRGTPKAERLSYYYSYCDYHLGDLLLASYRFKNFTKVFPASQWAEDALFMSAYCNFLNSPIPSLDQSPTYSAINDLELFTQVYDKSNLVDSCNTLIDILRTKLENKAYKNAYQYYHMRNYASAIYSFQSLIKDYPGTTYEKEATFLMLKANYLLAMNSVESKKEERIQHTIESYVRFVDSFAKSEELEEAEKIYENILKEKVKFNSTKKNGRLQKIKGS